MSSQAGSVGSDRTRLAFLQGALLVGAVGFVVWIIRTHGADLKAALNLTPRLFVLIFLSAIASSVLNGIEIQVLAGRFGKLVPFVEAQLLGLMTSTLNYLPLKTGTMLNGVLLHRRHALPFSDFAALIAGSNVVHLGCCGVMAGIALLLGGTTNIWLALLFLLAPTFIVTTLIVWGRARETGRFETHESRVLRAASRAVDGVGDIFSDGQLLAKEVAINIGLVSLWAARSYWCFRSIGIHASFGSVLTVTALGILFARVSVIPGGVGFGEAGAALGSTITGLSAGAGFAASVIDRAVNLIWLLIMGVPAAMYLLRTTGIGLKGLLGKPQD